MKRIGDEAARRSACAAGMSKRPRGAREELAACSSPAVYLLFTQAPDDCTSRETTPSDTRHFPSDVGNRSPQSMHAPDNVDCETDDAGDRHRLEWIFNPARGPTLP